MEKLGKLRETSILTVSYFIAALIIYSIFSSSIAYSATEPECPYPTYPTFPPIRVNWWRGLHIFPLYFDLWASSELQDVVRDHIQSNYEGDLVSHSSGLWLIGWEDATRNYVYKHDVGPNNIDIVAGWSYGGRAKYNYKSLLEIKRQVDNRMQNECKGFTYNFVQGIFIVDGNSVKPGWASQGIPSTVPFWVNIITSGRGEWWSDFAGDSKEIQIDLKALGINVDAGHWGVSDERIQEIFKIYIDALYEYSTEEPGNRPTKQSVEAEILSYLQGAGATGDDDSDDDGWPDKVDPNEIDTWDICKNTPNTALRAPCGYRIELMRDIKYKSYPGNEDALYREGGAIRYFDMTKEQGTERCPYSHPYFLGIFNEKTQKPPDHDGDNIPDACDNCLFVANEDQEDEDDNKIGDACECKLNQLCGKKEVFGLITEKIGRGKGVFHYDAEFEIFDSEGDRITKLKTKDRKIEIDNDGCKYVWYVGGNKEATVSLGYKIKTDDCEKDETTILTIVVDRGATNDLYVKSYPCHLHTETWGSKEDTLYTDEDQISYKLNWACEA